MTQNQAERHAAFVNQRIDSLVKVARDTAQSNVGKSKHYWIKNLI